MAEGSGATVEMQGQGRQLRTGIAGGEEGEMSVEGDLIGRIGERCVHVSAQAVGRSPVLVGEEWSRAQVATGRHTMSDKR